MNDYVVYIHECTVNGKRYVGMTNNVERRWRSNGIEYKPHEGKEHERPFWNAIKKHGWGSFNHRILECGLSDAQAQERERYYIALFCTRDRRFGYNVAEGGNGGHVYQEHPRGMLGKHHSEEKKKQQRELMKKLNAEGKCKWKNGHPKGMLGKNHSEEFKERLRQIPPHKHPSAKEVIIEYPDGTKKKYACVKYLVNDLNIGNNLISRIIKSGKPYTISIQCRSNLENLRKIEGALIYYSENTEVTEENKKSSAP